MARQLADGKVPAGTVERVPMPGDYDGVHPDEVEVIGRGAALREGRPFVLTVEVPLEMGALRAISEAAAAEGMDVDEYVRRAVQQLGKALRDRAGAR